jgi:mannitol 2-dehydrogenase
MERLRHLSPLTYSLTAPTPLTDNALAGLAHRAALPSYDRTRLSPGVVHIGVGGFHRAHQAVYLDDVAERGISSEWGIVGVSFRRAAAKAALAPQDHLYTVVERGGETDSARVVGALSRCLYVGEDRAAVRAALRSPQTRLVTLTITGDGYRDIRPSSGGVFDFLAEALEARMGRGVRPFTILSCDNLAENGTAARDATLRVADARSAHLARWISDHVAFPGSVVDRITPQSDADTCAYVARRFGIRDRAPVVTEPFSQWIVEDEFCNERPPLDEVGVRFVADTRGYSLAKRRMLNGGHSALGYVGYLLGHRTTDAAMEDPLVAGYIDRLLADEVAPLLAGCGLDLDEYRGSLVHRFGNRRLADPLARLCGRGSTKVPAYLLPSLAEACEQGRPVELLALALAAWIRYLRGVDLSGAAIEVADERLRELRPLVMAGQVDPRPILAHPTLRFVAGQDPRVANAIEAALESIARDGLRATVQRQAVATGALAA